MTDPNEFTDDQLDRLWEEAEADRLKDKDPEEDDS